MLKMILKPGLEIFRHLTIYKKFLMIFILYLFPVGYTAYYALTKHSITLSATQEEISNLGLIKNFKPVIENIAKTRALYYAVANGNSSAQPQISSAIGAVDSNLNLASNHAEFANLSSQQKLLFSSINNEWSRLKSAASVQNQQEFDQYSALIRQVQTLMTSILEQSTLMTDSEAHTSFLISSLVKEIPVLTEVISQTTGMGGGIAAKQSFTSETFIALSNYYKQLGIFEAVVKHSFDGAATQLPQLKSLSPLFNNFDASLMKFMNTTKARMIDPDDISVSSQAYLSEGEKVIEQASLLYESTYRELIRLLEIRHNNVTAEVWMNMVSSIALLLAAIYLFACFSQNISDSINRIKDCVNAVADGDLTKSVDIQSEDEMKTIGHDINIMVDNTKSLVNKVLDATNELVNMATKNYESASVTNERISQQNVEVEQVATAMNQMSATVQEVADNAEQTASSTASADNDSKAGYQIVESTITSINELAEELNQASSSINALQENVNSIGSVLDVIQGIADQTNLLALNAAIEAARAGESGRGFAVVADEVRTLASKTQDSTKEIRLMIDKLKDSASQSVSAMESGNNKSQKTVEDAEKAGEALQQISQSVGHISLMGEQIASAATQQSSVAEEINRSILSVKDISELTSGTAQESAENSRSLDGVAKNLQSLVAQFKL